MLKMNDGRLRQRRRRSTFFKTLWDCHFFESHFPTSRRGCGYHFTPPPFLLTQKIFLSLFFLIKARPKLFQLSLFFPIFLLSPPPPLTGGCHRRPLRPYFVSLFFLIFVLAKMGGGVEEDENWVLSFPTRPHTHTPIASHD